MEPSDFFGNRDFTCAEFRNRCGYFAIVPGFQFHHSGLPVLFLVRILFGMGIACIKLGSRFRIQDSGIAFQVHGSGFRIWDSNSMITRSRFGVGFKVQGFRYRGVRRCLCHIRRTQSLRCSRPILFGVEVQRAGNPQNEIPIRLST